MEGTCEKRRRPAASSRAGRQSGWALTPREKKRLIQLGLSILLFALAFFGRGVFPREFAQWQDVLCRDLQFERAFSGFGRAISRGEPVLDSLETLWVEVFADGTGIRVTVPPKGQTGDPLLAINRWYQSCLSGGEKLIISGETREPGILAKEEPTSSPEEPIPEAAPKVLTAQPQSYTEQGVALPASVSLQFYDLGLGNMVTPLAGTLTSEYGYRDHPVNGTYTFHRGIDIGAAEGTPIFAFADGVVSAVGESGVSGLYLQIDHENGAVTFYAHCSRITVKHGQQVAAGQMVAETGQTGNATGPHLHFALIKDGVYLNPMYYLEAA